MCYISEDITYTRIQGVPRKDFGTMTIRFFPLPFYESIRKKKKKETIIDFLRFLKAYENANFFS